MTARWYSRRGGLRTALRETEAHERDRRGGATTSRAELDRRAARPLPRPQERARSRRCATCATARPGMTLNALRDAARGGASRRARRRARARRARPRADRGRRRRHAPRRRRSRSGTCTRSRRRGGRSRTRSSASATRSATTARSRRSSTTSTSSRSTRGTRRARTARRSSSTTTALLRTETSPSPDPRDGGARAADLHGLDRPLLPARRDRRDALPDLPPVRGPRRRPRADARRPEGDAAARDARDLRARPARPLPHALLPVHRALDGARRLLRDLRRRGLPHVPATPAGSRWAAPGMVDPRVFENVGIDPEEWSGLRLRLRDRARRAAQVRLPGHPRRSGTATCAC